MKNNFTKRIFITGSAGFIGKNFVKTLIRSGYRNLTLLDLNQKVFTKGSIKGIKGSFCDAALMSKILPGHAIIVHLAAVVGVHKALQEKDMLRQVNLTGTKQFIDLSIRHAVEKIVFPSSSEVYGNSHAVPFREDAVLSPISEYARYKIAIEKYLAGFVRAHKIKATVVRFFNVYGPGQRTDFVVNTFVKNAYRGNYLYVNWDGRQTRCFTFIDDATRGLMLAMQYTRKPFNIFNIGNDEEISVLDLARMVIVAVHSTSSNIVLLNKNKRDRYDVLYRVPYLEHSKKELGYESHITLRKGLQKIIDGTK